MSNFVQNNRETSRLFESWPTYWTYYRHINNYETVYVQDLKEMINAFGAFWFFFQNEYPDAFQNA